MANQNDDTDLYPTKNGGQYDRFFLIVWRAFVGGFCTLLTIIVVWMFSEIRDLPVALSGFATTAYVDLKCKDCATQNTKAINNVRESIYNMEERLDKRFDTLVSMQKEMDRRLIETARIQDNKIDKIFWHVAKIRGVYLKSDPED